jgi:hypothetical protein
MAKPKKLTPEEEAEGERREKEFRELLERRRIRDAELRAKREGTAALPACRLTPAPIL